MQPRISMITLGVNNLAKAIAFYRDGLGFAKIESSDSVAFFNLNGSWLGLYGSDALAEDAGVAADASGFNHFALAHNVESEAAVDKVMAEALAAGATLSKPAQKTFWGGYSGYFKDPDGHLWEIAHNSFIWIGPKDTP